MSGRDDNQLDQGRFRAEYIVLDRQISSLGDIDFAQSPTRVDALETVAFTPDWSWKPFWDGGADDHFAARITGDIRVETAGTYTFFLTSDDGSRLTIDGDPVIDNDGLHPAKEQQVRLSLQPGTVPLELLYFENLGHQILSLEWSGPDTGSRREFVTPVIAEDDTDHVDHGDMDTDDGRFRAEYIVLDRQISNLGDIDFAQTPTHVEALETVAFTFEGGKSMDPFWDGGPKDYFAARITGDILVETGGTYTFYLTSDDGSRLTIDGDPVIDNDGLHPAKEQQVRLSLQPGTVPLELLYFENLGHQILSLEWSGPDTGSRREFVTPVIAEDDTDHVDHGDMVRDPVARPAPETDVDDLVDAVNPEEETHGRDMGSPVHDIGSAKMAEHMAMLDLVPHAAATHVATGNGDWDDPATWHEGVVPGDGARVLIPEGAHVTYDHVGDARLFTVRVDGHLDFAKDVDSRMIVDTMVISPDGELTIGTALQPIAPEVEVDIVFANNGAIDTTWDPMLLSRGLVAHGTVEIHGARKDSHEKVVVDPMAGDTWIDFAALPEGWKVGDTIVIAGTRYDGYLRWDPSFGYVPPQDEERVISRIEGGRVHFDDPLQFDHDTPRDDLKTSVANYTRNVSFETEGGATAETHERGHVMFMHNDDVDVRYAEFRELGRTDKSEPARNVEEFDTIASDSNVKGRYSFHFHRAGMDDPDDPGIAIGNAVYDSPGWGFVHHDSNAVLDNNATFDTFGAGYVAESGNEIGSWTDNIAIFAKGNSWRNPKFDNDPDNFDLGRSGDGFWFQGRMVESSDNIAASVNTGFVYFHRGRFGEDKNIKFDAETSVIPEALKYFGHVFPDEHPILSFSDNETFASRAGLFIVKAETSQGHDVHSILRDFTAWDVKVGTEMSYTSHYTLQNFDLVGRGEGVGIVFGANAADITIVDADVSDFGRGIDLAKSFTINAPPEAHDFTLIDPTVRNSRIPYENYDPLLDDLILRDELAFLKPDIMKPDIMFDGPLTYREGDPGTEAGVRSIAISGTKTDSLGTTDFPSVTDNYSIGWQETRSLLDAKGYYSTSEGQNYFLLDIYFSDRLTGDIYVETHPVLLDNNVSVGEWTYRNVPFNGVLNLDEHDLLFDDATLWATPTDLELMQ